MSATQIAPVHAARPRAPRGTLVWGHHEAFLRDKLGFITGTAREFGDFVPLRFGPQRLFLLSDPAGIAEVLTTRAASFRKDRGLRRVKVLLGEGLLTSEGADHERRSRIAQPAFRPKAVETYAGSMVGLTEAAAAEWAARPEGRVDLWAELSRLTLGIAAETLFGGDVVHESPGFGAAFTELLSLIEHRTNALLPIPLAIPTCENRRFVRARRVLDEAVYGLIRSRRGQQRAGVERDDLLSRLLAPPADGGPALTDEQLRDEVMTLVLAGHETTANALSFTFALLARNPGALERVRAEVDRVLGARPASAADAAALVECSLAVQEAMRIYPPAWMIGREAAEDVELSGGRRVPAGAIVMMSPFVVQRDPRWWPEPLAFRPARFAHDAPRPAPFTYFPFGGGKRACIGRSFALLEATLVLATVIQRLELAIDPARPLDLVALITLRPKAGIEARVRAR
ncbi:MAG TPA: cytochrome P450 [Planctomycetota bacterium]|nr:cytochrome P450 [Planctomycetota bacterium]